jgi:glycosyltransferase involved in cell wall biosynthesis
MKKSLTEEKIASFKKKYALDGSKQRKILFVGPLIERKDPITLIKAIVILVHEFGFKELLLIIKSVAEPEPDYSARMKSFIAQEGLHEKIKIISEHLSNEEFSILYTISDIYVAPFLQDGSLSLLEPLAYGKPVIATNIEEIREVIKNGWNGILISPSDARELAEKIKYLIEHPDEMKRLGQNGQSSVEEYDCKKIVKKYISVYSELCRKACVGISS